MNVLSSKIGNVAMPTQIKKTHPLEHLSLDLKKKFQLLRKVGRLSTMLKDLNILLWMTKIIRNK